jgi:hypothetical protein
MPRYIARDGHEASPAERALLDYISARWHDEYQLRAAVDGTGYHLCTPSACCQFNDLAGLKEFLGESWRN